ncbi:hypothetical protein ACQP2U_42995 (plasmid) [Nocardia sp. CA-084685]|uniref:hypothetical protein n=1 Tax=Nocardia sp. CA-084685 TaxID=3239970 RepID=UPI003D984A58
MTKKLTYLTLVALASGLLGAATAQADEWYEDMGNGRIIIHSDDPGDLKHQNDVPWGNQPLQPDPYSDDCSAPLNTCTTY